MLGLQHLSERSRIRLASRGGAMALAAVFAVLMIQHPPTASGPPGAAFAPAIAIVTIVTPQMPHAEPLDERIRPATAGAMAFVEPSTTDGANGEGMRLWLDGPAGRVVFTDGEHYMRCLNAALEHRNAPGCPDAAQTFASAEQSSGPIVRFDRIGPNRRR